MKKIVRPQKNNSRNTRRVVMVKSVKGRILGHAGEGEIFRAQLVNVSFTGAQVYSNKVVQNNVEVALELDSLDGSHCLVYVGKVVWVRKNPMKSMGRFAYGVHFSGVTSDQIKFLENNYSLNPPAEN